MICIFHGGNTTASRNALYETIEKLRAKSPDAEVLHLDGNKLTETDLVEVLEAPSMIAPDRIVHIDGLLSRRPSKEKEQLIEKIYYNQSGPAEQDLALPDRSDYNTFLSLFLWETRQLTPSVIKKFQSLKNCKIQEFKLSKTLFSFLDSLAPNNGAKMTSLLASTLETEAPELVMFMLVRRVTELLLATSNDPRALDGVRTPWQRSQLSRQATHWTQPRLLEFHRKLLEIDEAVKTGSTPSNVATHLDILLLSL